MRVAVACVSKQHMRVETRLGLDGRVAAGARGGLCGTKRGNEEQERKEEGGHRGHTVAHTGHVGLCLLLASPRVRAHSWEHDAAHLPTGQKHHDGPKQKTARACAGRVS